MTEIAPRYSLEDLRTTGGFEVNVDEAGEIAALSIEDLTAQALMPALDKVHTAEDMDTFRQDVEQASLAYGNRSRQRSAGLAQISELAVRSGMAIDTEPRPRINIELPVSSLPVLELHVRAEMGDIIARNGGTRFKRVSDGINMDRLLEAHRVLQTYRTEA